MPPVQSRWVRSYTIAVSRKLVLCCFFSRLRNIKFVKV